MKPVTIFEQGLDEWMKARLALSSDPSAFDGWTKADWAAFRTLIQDFGGPWGQGPAERARREGLAGERLKRLERRDENGGRVFQPYSYGLHLAVLREDRERNGGLYEGLPEDDTMERYELLQRRKKR